MNKVLAAAGVQLPLLPKSFDCFVLPPDPTIAPQVATHADMIFTVFNKLLFFHCSYYEIYPNEVEFLSYYSDMDLCITEDERNSLYPFDVGLNALDIGGRLICRKDSICEALRDYPLINTKQGYAACTSLFAAGTVITADKATIKACMENNIPYYEISGKDILLPGYDTGFIGGACGVYKDTVYIYGNPQLSQSGRQLAEFCKIKGLSLYSVNDGPVTDIGGIKFLERK